MPHSPRHPTSSLWEDTLPEAERFHPTSSHPTARDLPTDVDVLVIGAGLTGLWAAYYLAAAGRSVTVIERDAVGFGASGRNGGWCSALLPMSLTALASRHGRPAAIRLQRTMHATLDEIERVLDDERIDCGAKRGGTIELARHQVHRERALTHLREAREFGFGAEDLDWLEADQLETRLCAQRVVGALVTPHCLAVHPGRLVHGLARVSKRHGVAIHEGVAALELGDHCVLTTAGPVRAEVAVLATEAYGCQLPGRRRSIVPLYSMMVATEPLPEAVWEHIGLADRATFTDLRRNIIYGQRTADNRIAFGGRGAPYHFGSTIAARFDRDDRVRQKLTETLIDMFPVLRDVEFTHHWGGPLGVHRDLHCAVTLDRRRGLATAGGYVGDGVATTNLAGRTLRDLILGDHTELVDLSWVGHRSRRWEPEPARWLGINATVSLASLADQLEDRQVRSDRRTPAYLAPLVGRVADIVARR